MGTRRRGQSLVAGWPLAEAGQLFLSFDAEGLVLVSKSPTLASSATRGGRHAEARPRRTVVLAQPWLVGAAVDSDGERLDADRLILAC